MTSCDFCAETKSAKTYPSWSNHIAQLRRVYVSLCAQFMKHWREQGTIYCADCGIRIRYLRSECAYCWYVMPMQDYYLATYFVCPKCYNARLPREDPSLSSVIISILMHMTCDALDSTQMCSFCAILCAPFSAQHFIMRVMSVIWLSRANDILDRAGTSDLHARVGQYSREARKFWSIIESPMYHIGARTQMRNRVSWHMITGTFNSRGVPSIEQVREDVIDALERGEYCTFCPASAQWMMAHENIEFVPIEFMESIDTAWGIRLALL